MTGSLGEPMAGSNALNLEPAAAPAGGGQVGQVLTLGRVGFRDEFAFCRTTVSRAAPSDHHGDAVAEGDRKSTEDYSQNNVGDVSLGGRTGELGGMQIKEAREVLSGLGIEAPELEVLQPTEASYVSLLLQPSGPILGGAARIGALDQAASAAKTLDFARLARERGAHLAVTPEYFAPWAALKTLIFTGATPLAGCLWILGCESIREEELTQFKADAPANCEVIYEPLDHLAADRHLLDPVALVFNSKRTNGQECLVVLVQFKTFPSRDKLFAEEAVLRCGTTVYRLGGERGKLSLVTLICSDVFALNEATVVDLVDRSTVVHIQLNPKPMSDDYRKYRATAFKHSVKSTDCHVLCLNWARTIVQFNDAGNTEKWPAVGGSTWYLPTDSCTEMDAVVFPNHQHGLYYTYMTERRHALVLDYEEAVFECRVPKVMTNGLAIFVNKNGPSAISRYEWNLGSASWIAQANPPGTGFTELMASTPDAATALPGYSTQSPLNIERLLALSAGAIAGGDSWKQLSTIDSFQIGSDELVHRITVVQGTDDKADRFRNQRLQAVAEIRHELDRRDAWPPQIVGVGKASEIAWDPAGKPFNVHGDGVKPALVCYLGENPLGRDVEKTASKLIDLLRRQGGYDDKRLCLIYRKRGELTFDRLSGLTRYDDALLDERDILSTDTDPE